MDARRTRLLAGTLAVVIASGIALVVVSTNSADSYAGMRARWVERLTGGSEYDPQSAPFADQIAVIDGAAHSAADGLDLTRPEPWNDLETATNVEDISEAYRRVAAMALAFRTHGSTLEGDETLVAEAVGALDWLGSHRYNADTELVGNWWHWRVGIPLALHQAMALLYGELSATQISDFAAASEHFTPSPTLTGANRVWTALIVAERGVLVESSSMVTAARTGVVPALQVVATGDGFHADDSFLQHTEFAYTGGYGLSFLEDVIDLIALLADSEWAVTDPAVANLYAWIQRAYDPFVVDGALMDTVRGREISRRTSGEHDAGTRLIQAVVLLSEVAPPAEREWLRPLVKGWIESAALQDPVGSGPIFVLARASALMSDSTVSARSPRIGADVFPDMARVVQHATGYTASVAMSSANVASYETLNGENRRGYFTGDGALWVYTDDATQFSGDFWATMQPYRVPGTTIDTLAREPGSGAGYLPASATAFAGGVESASGLSAVASYGLDAWNSPLAARKSWFLFDDEIVALGSGISAPGQTGTGWDGGPRSVQTIVEDRKLQDPGQQLVVDGSVVIASTLVPETVVNPGWAHLEGVGGVGELGYVFSGTAPVTFERDSGRTGSWSQINTLTGSIATVAEDYVSIWFDHGSSPHDAGYQYIVLPESTRTQTADYAASPDVVILANSTTVHAVRETTLGIMAATFWEAGTVASDDGPLLSSSAAAAVTVEDRSDGGYALTIADPTSRNRGSIMLELHSPAGAVVSASPGVTVTQTSPTVKIRVDVAGSSGAPFRVVVG